MAFTADAALDPNAELDPNDVETVDEGVSEEVETSTEADFTPDEGESEATEGEFYTVTVDGEELQVPLEELLNGYSRQRDYTRKTQQLAEQRRNYEQAAQLVQALDRDPVGTMRILAEAYGIAPDESPATDVDEVQERLIRIERQQQEVQRNAQRQAIYQELDGLADKYGDFDYEEIVQYAVNIGTTDLEAALLKHQAVNKAQAEVEAQRKARTQKALEAKRAARVVEGGSTRRNTDSGLPKRPSLLEALAAAESSTGQRL